MNTIEEKLWNYIDGSCSEEERKAIDILIAQDEVYRRKYEELLSFDQQISNMELDEPPMAFTYNVMEGIRAEYAQQPLKSAINKRIIKGIGIFFIVTITLALLFAMSNIHLSSGNSTGGSSLNFKIPNIKNYFTPGVIEGFLFFDVVL